MIGCFEKPTSWGAIEVYPTNRWYIRTELDAKHLSLLYRLWSRRSGRASQNQCDLIKVLLRLIGMSLKTTWFQVVFPRIEISISQNLSTTKEQCAYMYVTLTIVQSKWVAYDWLYINKKFNIHQLTINAYIWIGFHISKISQITTLYSFQCQSDVWSEYMLQILHTRQKQT